MPLEYCNEIVELCQKYDIACDDTMPYGILDAEYDLEKFLINIVTDNIKLFNDYLKNYRSDYSTSLSSQGL